MDVVFLHLDMKRFLHKIGATVLAFVVLFSSFSFTMDTHYCGEFVVDTAYFGKAKGCGMDEAKMATKDQVSVTKKSCCKNVTEFVSAPEFKNTQIIQLTQNQLVFVASFVSSYAQLFKESILQKTFYSDFSPPDILENIQVLYQTFLI